MREETRDRYGRTVGHVYVDGRGVNAELVRAGYAWVYQKYATDRSLSGLEAEAKAAQRGFWALPEAQWAPPWEWRHGGRQPVQAHSLSALRPPAARSHYCREMVSCEEARHYLSACGDGDGNPCDRLCRGRSAYQYQSIEETLPALTSCSTGA